MGIGIVHGQTVEIIEIELFWYATDQEYVVRLKNQPGISTLAKTMKEALTQFGTLLPDVIELAGITALSNGDAG